MNRFSGFDAGGDAAASAVVRHDGERASEPLDFAAATRVLQALSGEIVLEDLICTVMRVALEQAGAQRGLLILSHQGTLRIQAHAGIGADGVIAVERRLAGVTPADLPATVFQRVLRSKEPVLLHDASSTLQFSADEYVGRHRVRSVLCLPLFRQARVIGMIYLENNLAPGAFTPQRIALMELLALQAASALEHARLYRHLQKRESRVRRLVESNIIGIVIWHADGRILDTNQAFVRLVGHAREDLVSGRVRWTDMTPPEWGEQDAARMQELKERGALPAHERELFRQDGTRVPVLVGSAMFEGSADEGVAFVLDLSERKRAEQALRDMERESRMIVDTIPGLVATLTPGGALEAVNKGLIEYCGHGVEGFRQWRTNGSVHPEDMCHVGEVFLPAIAAGRPYEFEARIRRFDGAYRWFQVRGFPLRDAAGQVARWYVLLSDVDDRRRAEQAVLASERNLKLIVDTIPALAWSSNADGGVDFFNRHYLDFIGFSEQQAAGWGWSAAVHPEDREGLVDKWRHILARGEPGEAEARLRRRDGEYRWILFRAHPLRGEGGEIVKWYGANTDIEDRRRAEAELRRAYDSFADAQRLSRTGSFITDLLGEDHSWSPESYRIFEFEPGSRITLERIREAIHPDDLAGFQAMIVRAIAGADVQFAFRIVAARGVKHVRGVAHVVEQIVGRPMFVGAMQDVTESVVAEEALSKARSELAHVARITSLSTLTASITHEVSQPLSGIVTNANTCLRMLDADPPNVEGARETARRSLRDGTRAAEVISRLRALFGKKEYTLEQVDLNETFREVIALSLSELQSNRAVLQLELAEPLPCVTGDRIQLQQVMLNLLRNAAEAMADVDDRPRNLVVRTELQDEECVRVSVRDAGVGLDGQAAARLFQAFYTTKSDGMGIGLSVSRSIIERHHGRLWAEPNEGPGATFSFSIPLSPA